MVGRAAIRFIVSGVVFVATVVLLRWGHPSASSLLDPIDGLYRAARVAEHPQLSEVNLPALDEPVNIYRDNRGVPHIFAGSDRDAVIALGYAVAQDRLFQLDFIPRVASGRLAAIAGPGAVSTDRFMRSIGMELGAERNTQRVLEDGGIEAQLAEWYCSGVNGYLDKLHPRVLPIEFRVLDYRPDRCSALQIVRVLQFMTYDLTFKTDYARYGRLKEALSPDDYAQLYPEHAPVNEPIIPGTMRLAESESERIPDSSHPEVERVSEFFTNAFESVREAMGIGFEPGLGSNNWTVSGRRSTTGSPILAGDMHLRVSLPAIWYEAHLVTPEVNLYGVTIPGAPYLIEAFNDRIAWAFTNTGSDQIDHVALEVHEDGSSYRVDGNWQAFQTRLDTIKVKGSEPVVDTLRFSEWGPVIHRNGQALALRWVAHDTSRTLEAIWEMAHARDLGSFEAAIRKWDTPVQNILYADVDGNIAVRSTGFMPIRRAGLSGKGVVDGRTGGPIWVGRVPFEELPHARNPEQGFLASANQQPVGAGYPHYLGHDWRSIYRGIRINEILRAKPTHSVEDLRLYQADVVAVYARELAGLLTEHKCANEEAEQLRSRVASWNGDMTVDRLEPILFDLWLKEFSRQVWDEPELQVYLPYRTHLVRLLRKEIDQKWFDRRETPRVETARDIVCSSFEAAAVPARSFVAGRERTWGDAHRIIFRHLLRSDRLDALSRGPYAYPGADETLSPGEGHRVTHSASWRVVVDLSSSPPRAFGVYPGGQSGNPLSRHYAAQLDTYLSFGHFELQNSREPADFEDAPGRSRLTLSPPTVQ